MAQQLLARAVAPSTFSNYKSACKNYLRFCHTHTLTPFPPVEDTLILYATQVSTYSSYANIKLHLAAIRHFTIRRSMVSPIPSFQRLYMLLKGIKRAQGTRFRRRKRDPITPPTLLLLHQYLFAHDERHYNDKLMIWAALLTAFFGFLRVSEYTSPTKSKYDPNATLLNSDLTLSSTNASLVIKSSKTDPFRVGVTLRMSANGSLLCPIRALSQYIRTRSPPTPSPLFMFRNGSFLTRRDINKFLTSATTGAIHLSSHSLRIGAASSAAAMGCPEWLIQCMGRWSSDCYKDYLRVSNRMIDKASKSLARYKSVPAPYAPKYRS